VCGGGGGGGGSFPPESIDDVMLTPAFASVSFSFPVKLVQHPTDANRWYVVQQAGQVRTFLVGNPGAHSLAVNVGASVNLSADDEQGLLGLAFDPDFDTSGGEVYLAYTDEDAGDSVLARYVSTNGVTFAAAASPIVLAIPHPANNHNGGDISFGTDEMLYYSMGDGGGSGNSDNGQNTMMLLGKVLRIDVRSTPPMGRTYAIPAGNPFGTNAFCDDGDGTVACPEIWAWGFRNPWRMSFDPQNGQLWLGDVGQGTREEVDRVVNGGNYGWDCFEGDVVFNTGGTCATPPTAVAPEAVYDSVPGTRAVTGGVVYRGTAISGLAGHYLYADYYGGEIWAIDTTADEDPILLIDTDLNIAAFGQGRDGAVYVVTHDSPSIYQIVPEPG
jgi:glucose/arabinose dehydrogenase